MSTDAAFRLPPLLFLILFLPFSFAAGGEEFVYEGKSATEWAKELKAGNNVEKAQHALAVLGKDSIPALMQLLREPDPKVTAAALAVLKDLKLDADGVALVLPLLKDESFQVRRAAVRLLGSQVASDKAVAAAVKAALKDKDKAVVEAAEEVLNDESKVVEERILRKRFDKFLADAKTDVANGNLYDAKVHLELARSLGLNDPEARNRLVDIMALLVAAQAAEKQNMIAQAAEKQNAEGKRKEEAKPAAKLKDSELQKTREESNRRQQLEVLLKQSRILTDKGDLENARRILLEAAKLFPDDPRLADAFRNVDARMHEQGKDDGLAPEKRLYKKPAADALIENPKPKIQNPKPAPGEGKGKEFDQQPVLPPQAPEGMF